MDNLFDDLYENEEYYEDISFAMDYIFSANVTGSSLTKKVCDLVGAFRKEQSVVTFTFSGGEILNIADLTKADRDMTDVQIEFESQYSGIMAQIDVYKITEHEYEITMMMPHEELKATEKREEIILIIAKKFFTYLNPEYGVTGEQVFARPTDEITDDEFVSAFEEIGFIGGHQYKMREIINRSISKFDVTPLSGGELFVRRDFMKEVEKIERKHGDKKKRGIFSRLFDKDDE